MRVFLNTEQPPRLVIVSEDAKRHGRLAGVVDFFLQETVKTEARGVETHSSREAAESLKRDLANTAVHAVLVNPTGQESVSLTSTHQYSTLQKAITHARADYTGHQVAWWRHHESREERRKGVLERIQDGKELDAMVNAVSEPLDSLPVIEATQFQPNPPGPVQKS